MMSLPINYDQFWDVVRVDFGKWYESFDSNWKQRVVMGEHVSL